MQHVGDYMDMQNRMTELHFDMEIFSILLVHWPLVDSPHKWPVMQSINVFSDVILNMLSKQTVEFLGDFLKCSKCHSFDVTLMTVIYCICPMKCTHGLVWLHFPVVIRSVPIFYLRSIMDSINERKYMCILQRCFTCIGAIVWLPMCQWSNHAGYGLNHLVPSHHKTHQSANHVHISCEVL